MLPPVWRSRARTITEPPRFLPMASISPDLNLRAAIPIKKGVAAIIAQGKLAPALGFPIRCSFSIVSLQGFDVTLGLSLPGCTELLSKVGGGESRDTRRRKARAVASRDGLLCTNSRPMVISAIWFGIT